ncbi:hypothetical protein [Noviherbaspirillum soli]|uniref:hypothetical protein n=1 Tax=Noviherbaspirillum soli TaxID=1064518 RepID=UPI001E311B75|nr:hypothetical protein [Noviherbaspirillum soli]
MIVLHRGTGRAARPARVRAHHPRNCGETAMPSAVKPWGSPMRRVLVIAIAIVIKIARQDSGVAGTWIDLFDLVDCTGCLTRRAAVLMSFRECRCMQLVSLTLLRLI